MTLAKFPIISNEALLNSMLRIHPEYQRATVCTCGKVMSMTAAPGHMGGSNKKWTVKAKFAKRHAVAGYTLMARGPDR